MNELLFYEKPGCVGNGRQRALLRSHGHHPLIRDLLSEPWTAQRLRPFFGDRPVAEWFNLSAPRVKSGEIPIQELDASQALALMLEEPLLICRPLLQYGAAKQSGFMQGPVLDALGISLDPRQDLQSCPVDTPEPVTCDTGWGESA